MSKVFIVSDSTACLPTDEIIDLPIFIAPLQVIWGDEQFRDGIDITPTQFYDRLTKAEIMPSTSQTTPGTFKEVYQDLLSKGYEILSIHISSKLSGTIDSAVQAKSMLDDNPNIEIIDSETTGMALGFQALSVARAAANGASLQECKNLALKAKDQTGVLFAVKTLEFLHRGGRIGGASAFLGTMLNLKPILEVADGRIEAAGKVRTMVKAVEKATSMVFERAGDTQLLRIAVHHANAREEAEKLLEKITGEISHSKISEVMICEISPVLGTHTGPGALGISYMTGM